MALTDNAFAVFVLSEHGFVGGAVLLTAYLALALLLLGSATIAGRAVNEVPRGILLGGLAMYVAVPALYMAAANVSLLPLTGQNLPLLGLRSGADVAFASWTLALAVIALPRATGVARGVTERAEINSRAMRRLAIILGAVAAMVVLVGAVVVRSLYRATHREVAPFQLATFADGLRAAVERADIVQTWRLDHSRHRGAREARLPRRRLRAGDGRSRECVRGESRGVPLALRGARSVAQGRRVGRAGVGRAVQGGCAGGQRRAVDRTVDWPVVRQQSPDRDARKGRRGAVGRRAREWREWSPAGA